MAGRPDLHDPETEALLSAYLDGELEDEGRRAVEAHLAACNRCRALLADLRRVKRLVAELPLETPARPVVVRPRSARRLAELAGVAALVAGLLLLGADLLLPRPTHPLTAPAAGPPAPAAADRATARPESVPAETRQPPAVRPLIVVGAGLTAAGGLGFLALRLGWGRTVLLIGLLGLAGGLVAGCGESGPGGGAEPPVPPEAERIVAAVRADAARRSGQDPSRVRLASLEAVDWPDTSLGCPESGKFYAQVITPGYKIVVRAGETDYEYHTDRAGNFVLCVRGQPSAR